MSPQERRHLLIQAMNKQEGSGISCQGCAGTCCTYEANSMMVTPLEAIDLISYLRTSGQLTEELKSKMQETIKTYRLDRELSTGKGSTLRRTYTCPFFTNSEFGCPLPRDVKPYGCLAFNSHHKTEKTAEHCYSDVDLLNMREDSFFDEDHLNQEIREKFKLSWDKLPMPVALNELWSLSI
jgi:Fe-S-cluster containining protein